MGKSKYGKEKKMELNQTPVRTSKNFNINNIKLENVKIPKKIEELNNVEIINGA